MTKDLISAIKQEIPEFEIRSKKDYWLQRAVGFVLGLFGIPYMTSYVTTFYPHIYVPEGSQMMATQKGFEILAHEYVHLLDTKESPFWFRFSYLFPQILGIILPWFSLLAIWFSNLWLLWLLSIILLVIPLPAYWRSKWEFRGYGVSMAVAIWLGYYNQEMEDKIIKQFIGPNYLFMWPFKKSVGKKIAHIKTNIELFDSIGPPPLITTVKSIIFKRGVS